MNGPHHFGVTRVRPNPIDVPEIERIAHEHGATYYEAFLPDGFQACFACENRGEPFDSATARAVLDAIRAVGIAYGERGAS